MTTYFIYKICCNDNTCADFYIGSTQNVRLRKSQHKRSCITESDKSFTRLIYTKIRENGGWDNWRMVVLEEMPNTTLIQARIREEHYRVELQATLNMCSAYSGLSYNELPKSEYFKQYYETNKDKMDEQQKTYREENKDIISEKSKAYRETIKDKMKDYQKTYREKNKDKRSEKGKAYYEKNKDKILETVICSCGRTLSKNALKLHLTTKIHNNILMKTI